jgi:hypothetical protein
MKYFESGYPTEYNGVKVDSDIEYGFCCWCEALKQMGFILDYVIQPNKFIMLESFTIDCTVKSGKKENIENKTLLEESGYTSDFEIKWNPEKYIWLMKRLNWTQRKLLLPMDIGTYSLFDWEQCRQRESIPVMIDVKGSNDTRGAATASSNLRFSYQRKLLFHANNIFTCKVIPDKLYKCTFVPDGWNTSPKTGKRFKRYNSYPSQEEFRSSYFMF